jgi:hypothetical protein
MNINTFLGYDVILIGNSWMSLYGLVNLGRDVVVISNSLPKFRMILLPPYFILTSEYPKEDAAISECSR